MVCKNFDKLTLYFLHQLIITVITVPKMLLRTI